MTDSSQASPMFTEEWWLGPQDTKFYTRTYAAASPRAVMLFVHGFAEYVARYEWAHGVYAARGITVFAFDQRGFGRTVMDEEHRSPGSTYCMTTFKEQLADMEWWLRHVSEQFPGLPIFLMGHSMGGGPSLAFPTQTTARPPQESLALLSGVIATSPLLGQPSPVSRPVRFLVCMIGKVFPRILVSLPVDSNALTHDKAVNDAAEKDRMCPKMASLGALNSALGGFDQVRKQGYKHWPRKLPLLMVHGAADKVTSHQASVSFFSKVDGEDLEFKTFEDGFHELVHEPDGVKEKFVNECIAWILARAGPG